MGNDENKAWSLWVLNKGDIPSPELANALANRYFNNMSKAQRVHMIYDSEKLNDRSNMMLDLFYQASNLYQKEYHLDTTRQVLEHLKSKREKDITGRHQGVIELFDDAIGSLIKRQLNFYEQKSINENKDYSGIIGEYRLVLDNMDGIIENMMPIFRSIEGIRFDVSRNKLVNTIQSMENDAGISQSEQLYEEYISKEEMTKDG